MLRHLCAHLRHEFIFGADDAATHYEIAAGYVCPACGGGGFAAGWWVFECQGAEDATAGGLDVADNDYDAASDHYFQTRAADEVAHYYDNNAWWARRRGERRQWKRWQQ